MVETRRLQSGRHEVALHTLQAGSGTPLLLLHALAGASNDWGECGRWPGPVYALDFSGHGASDWIAGGGYYPELFTADADRALLDIGACHVVGVGVGAYVALLLAGARPDAVLGALLLPGAGGLGVSEPDIRDVLERSDGALASFEGPRRASGGTDPMVAMVENDARPDEYAKTYAERALRLVLAPGGSLPKGWWSTVADVPGVSITNREGDPILLATETFQGSPLPTGTTDG